MTQCSVLIIEDEEPIQLFLQQILERSGYGVTCVGRRVDATKLIKQQQFDVIVTDVLLPDGDGLELIMEIKKKQPAVRIIAMSGGGRYLTSADCLRMAKQLGAHAILSKPFTESQLFDALRLSSAPPCEIAS